MSKPLLHPMTAQQVDGFLHAPGHALLLVGPTGSGKHTVAQWLAAELLKTDRVEGHPYVRSITSFDGKSIGIDAIRELEKFLQLKVPNKHAVQRLVIVEQAQLLTEEAQNALLKTLEEPPHGTILLVTVASREALLPTILSRTQQIDIKRLDQELLKQQFSKMGFDPKAIRQAMLVSGGLPGLAHALLDDTEHPLTPAIETARKLLGGSTYERLLLVDELSKQRSFSLDVLFILQQMSRVSLQTGTEAAAVKWQRIMEASYEADAALRLNVQPKLALTNLMLNL